MRVVVLEDEPLYCDLLAKALAQYAGMAVVGTFDNGRACLEAAVALRPDVALIDIELPGGMNGIEVGLSLRRHLSDLGIVLLSNHRDPAFLSSLRRGRVAGWSYLQKKNVSNVDALKRAIDGAAAGFVVLDHQLVADAVPKEDSPLAGLTPRQINILELMAQGYTNAAIGEKLGLSVKTVENHINALYQVLRVDRDAHYQPRVLAVLEYLAHTQYRLIG